MLTLLLAATQVLRVGDGMPFSRIEDAVAAAPERARIEVYPLAAGYHRVAVRVTKPDLTIIAPPGPKRVELEGAGFDYSGVGSVPRAIFQVEAGASGTTIAGFRMAGAHNSSHNGAGVRINAANHVHIENCEIVGNDMGIMSNGLPGNEHAGEDQVVALCDIHDNGDPADPGYNHNLYLGGTSVRIMFSEIHGAVTGHNLKSRAHFTEVYNCHLYGGQNRQVDLVESWDTERPNSNAVLIGNLIEMGEGNGNRNVVHFGQEKGKRTGTLYMQQNTVVTDYVSPVVLLDSPTSSVRFDQNVVLNKTQHAPTLFAVGGGATLAAFSGEGNAIAPVYRAEGTTVKFEPITDTWPKQTWVTYQDGQGVPHKTHSLARHTGPLKWVRDGDLWTKPGVHG